jgi:hypothetical protein
MLGSPRAHWPKNRRLSQAVALCSIMFGASACFIAPPVKAVQPLPNVSLSGQGRYSLDVDRVPNVLRLRGVTISEVQASVQAGFQNAVGSAYSTEKPGTTRLVFDFMDASIDEGRFGVLRVKYRCRWIAPGGEEVKASGTALPKNPTQTGEGHWRDVLEVMLEQLVGALDAHSRTFQNRAPSTDGVVTF